MQHRLNGGEHVLLGDEAHLHIELIELPGRAVSTRVFVAEARGNLEVAVKTRHHQQLLKLLRSLGQGIELARMQTRGHEEVARAFWARGGQDRGLEFGEPLPDHALAHRINDVGAQDDVAMQGLAAQIEIAMLEAQFLGIVWLTKDRDGQFGRFRQDLDACNADFNFARRQSGIHRIG